MASEWEGWEVRSVKYTEWPPRVIDFEPVLMESYAAHPVTITPTPLAEARARVIEAAKERGKQDHNDTCSHMLSEEYDCSCGHDELRAALTALQREEARDGE